MGEGCYALEFGLKILLVNTLSECHLYAAFELVPN